MAGPPNLPNYTGQWIALVRRYECNFEDKIRNAQRANFDAVIVHNVNSSDLGERKHGDIFEQFMTHLRFCFQKSCLPIIQLTFTSRLFLWEKRLAGCYEIVISMTAGKAPSPQLFVISLIVT
jgi:hypothetical protein